MSVNATKPPRPPDLTGNFSRDMPLIHDWMVNFWRTTNALYERTGGSSDLVAATADTAGTAAATASASQAGATIPTEGGAVTLNPANPLSYTATVQTATISVAGHTRSDAASPLVAANVSPAVARDATYYVYYSDAGDLGGAQTFLASTSLSTVTGTAGYRIIGAIYIPPHSFPDREYGD